MWIVDRNNLINVDITQGFVYYESKNETHCVCSDGSTVPIASGNVIDVIAANIASGTKVMEVR